MPDTLMAPPDTMMAPPDSGAEFLTKLQSVHENAEVDATAPPATDAVQLVNTDDATVALSDVSTNMAPPSPAVAEAASIATWDMVVEH